MINLAELEEKDYNVLLSLEDQFSNLPLRIGTLQTAFGWGYNRTFRTVKKAVERGALQVNYDRGIESHYTFTGTNLVQQALKITGFSLCSFKSNGQDECCRCMRTLKVGANVYFESTCYESDEGNYYCEGCLIGEPERIKKELEAWAEHSQSMTDN